tara:strand:+ start:1017 stop:2339 length:1323 start_codon:yes stop_codon:yes gene_type:complete
VVESLPHSEEIEREILGSVLVRPSLVGVVIELGLRPDDMYFDRHRLLTEAILALGKEGRPVDEVTIRDELTKRGDWEKSGGTRTLGEVLDKSGTSENIEDYVHRVRAYSAKRKLIEAGQSVSLLGYGSSEPSEALSRAQQELGKVEAVIGAKEGLDASSGVSDYVDYVKMVQSGELVETRIPTGVRCLDDHLGGGFKTGWQVVVLSAAGHGKTAFAVNNVALTAARAGHPVLICSLEMQSREVYGRMIAAISGVPVHIHDRPGLTPDEFSRFAHGANTVKPLPIKVIGSEYGSVSDIRRVARQMKSEYGRVGLVVVDYLQLMKSGSSRKDSTAEEDIATNSKGLKHLAVELDCTTVVLSQPTLAAKRDQKRPKVLHAKGSGSIEDDCDLALVPWLPFKVSPEASRAAAELGMDKFRHGPQQDLSVTDIRWNGRNMRFEDI